MIRLLAPGARKAVLSVAVLLAAGGLGSACSNSGTAGAKAGSSSTTRLGVAPISITPDGSLVLPDLVPDAALSECAQLGASYAMTFTRAGTLTFGGSAADFAKLEAQMADVQAKLPTALREPFGVVERAYADFSAKAKGADMSTAEGAQALAEATQIFDTPALHEANDTINRWFVLNCSSEDPLSDDRSATTPFTTADTGPPASASPAPGR